MPHYQISHKTTYEYASEVIQSNHLLHLLPRPVAHQTSIRHFIDIDPAPTWRVDRTDAFGNPVTILSIEAAHKTFSVHAVSEIDVTAPDVPDLKETSPWQTVVEQAPRLEPGISDFVSACRQVPTGELFRDFARPSFADGTPVLEGVRHLTERIFTEFQFDNTATEISTPVDTVLKQRAGVCQDFAHLAIAAVRSLAIPARYVSGYILTHPPEGEDRLIGADASHAWISVWAPETGWVDFDPTNNLINSADHITIAVGRDYDDVSPVSGVLLGGGAHTVKVAVTVQKTA